MRILIAKTAGFCMGVRRAVEMALDAPNKHKTPIYTLGPLIHNPQVLSLLEERGIFEINDIPDHGSGTILIRAHGTPPETKKRFKKAGFTVIDATCPRVVKVQAIIDKHAGQGYASIIIGDKEHPEVIGLLGYAGGKGYVAGGIKEFNDLPAFDNAIIVAQTTQNTIFFKKIKDRAIRKYPHYKIFDTICDSTVKRQAEVNSLAEVTDAIVVVGGHNSGNTQRLFEIAGQTGKPVYHIETETELNDNVLASAQCIGLTAGASTPNWIIKKVYRAIKALPLKKKEGWRKTVFTAQRFLLLTNIYVSIGAGCLCYACTKLLGINDHLQNVLIAVFYVQSMHILNNLTGVKADRFNDPDRAHFYNKHKIFLILLALISGGIGIITASAMGWAPFLILFLMSIMGLLYNIKLVPQKTKDYKYRRIRDIPGSKTVLITLAWGIVTSIFPALSESGEAGFNTALVFTWSVCMVFVRTAFFDILDMQGDRIVGKETIPILLGEKQTLTLLKSILLFVFILLFLSSVFHFVANLGYALAICPIIILSVIVAHEKGYMLPGIGLEFLIETQFVLTGIITLLWSVLAKVR